MKHLLCIFTVLSFCMLASCKKGNTVSSKGDTFFKLYDCHIQNNIKTTNSTISSSGSVTMDAEGNTYVWYFDSLISGSQTIAIMKIDRNGNKIWNVGYSTFYPCRYDLDEINNNYIWKDFACIGHTLFLCCSDPTRTDWYLLKINGMDGTVMGQFPLNGLKPASKNEFLINNMWVSKEGNILLGIFYGNSIGGIKPAYAMYDQMGNQVWVNNSIPYPVADSGGNYQENPFSITELNNGNFLCGGIGNYTNGNLTSSTLYFHYLSSSGKLIYTDSLVQGTYNSAGDPPFVNSNGAAQIFSMFPSPLGGYLIVCTETYDLNTDLRVKILKTDSSFHVTDSSYVGLGSSFLSGIVQNSDGDIIISVFSQVIPLPNAICNLYKISPGGSVTAQKQIGLSNESVYISGMNATNDGHILMSGLIQLSNVDTNNLFVLKTDNNINF